LSGLVTQNRTQRSPDCSDTFIQKTKRIYLDTRATRNVKLMNEELKETVGIAQKTIDEVLGRGERLESTPPRTLRSFQHLKV
jgi:hypothetical protein